MANLVDTDLTDLTVSLGEIDEFWDAKVVFFVVRGLGGEGVRGFF